MITLIAATIILACLVYQLIKPDPRLKEASVRLPGPVPRFIVGNAFDIPVTGPAAPDGQGKLFEKYGSCFRMWAANKLIYFTCNSSDIEALMKSTVEIDKGFIYKYFSDWIGDGLIFSSGDKWHKRRKALTPSFYFQILDQFIPVMSGRNANTLIRRLQDKVGKGEFDITPYISAYTLDVICETSMESFIDVQNDPNSTHAKSISEITNLLQHRINNPWLDIDILYRILGYKAQEWKHIKNIRQEYIKILANIKNTDKPINEATNGNGDLVGRKKKLALIRMLMKLKAEHSESFQTDEDIREEVDTFIFAGHETTTSAICFALSCLARHQEIQEEAYQEIKHVLGEKDVITLVDLNNLKYLERVIKETLRLYPSAPMIARQLKNDITLPSSGHTIPANAMIMINFFHLHRNGIHFPDPLVFNPDNFLPEVTAKRSPFAYLPFSSGLRNCIGQRFAVLEMKSALAKLLRSYRFTCEPNTPKAIPVRFSVTLHPINGSCLQISNR